MSIASAVSVVGYAAFTTPDAETDTRLYLATERNGERISANYPREFTSGEDQSLTVVVENHEHEMVIYSVVVQIERVEDGDVTDAETVDRGGGHVALNMVRLISNRSIVHTPFHGPAISAQ